MFGSLFRIALPLVARQGLKSTLAGLRRQAALYLAAAILFAAAFVFALIALYALLLDRGLEAKDAAGLIAAGLAALAGLILAANALRNRRRKRSFRSPLADGDSPLGAIDQQADRLMRQAGPLTLLAAAFAIGLTAGRRK